MRWAIVRTIFGREVKDQFRDRRTLFMILGLPILLYPILGIGMAFLISMFEQKPRIVVLVGSENLPSSPLLLNDERTGFRPELFVPPTVEEASRLRVQVVDPDSGWEDPKKREKALRKGLADAVIVIPADAKSRLASSNFARLPVIFNSADDESNTCSVRVRDVLARWRDMIVSNRLKSDNKPESYVDAVRVEARDVATREESGGNVWARLFPFLLVMMSLTGAFYPAIDICAGEKERGTMETLLISPATRLEIVMGKFLTVMAASIVTALLNLVSMWLTGWQLVRQLGAPVSGSRRVGAILTSPSLDSAFWMLLLLIPLSVFFSAICLALAVMAKSMKEGQYYMTPLYLVALPLMLVTLFPGIELNMLTSLVPITGASLLLRTLMQGKYAVAAEFCLPVLLPTILYGVLALRFAVDQFQSESVLFREADRFNLKDYLRHLVRDREPTPGPGLALLCFALMLSSSWFIMPLLGASSWSLVAGQAAFILLPPVLLALFLTSNPLKTLLMVRPRATDLFLGAFLAISLNPLVSELRPIVERLFPIPEQTKKALAQMMEGLPHAGFAILIMLAIVPAICEEVAFRGFILSGFRRDYRRWSAIVLSALLFGFLHVFLSLFQQLFNATLLGLVLGLLAIKTRSLWPCIVFHAVNNGLAVVLGMALDRPGFAGLGRVLYRNLSAAQYRIEWILGGAVASALMIGYLWTRPDDDGAAKTVEMV